MHDLQLAVNLAGWRIFVKRKGDKAFLPIQQKIFERDGYTCQFCGFQAKEYQDIINLDGNYNNNKISNLVTACCFCSQCLFLESVGVDDMGGGQLIYLEEMSQADLNSFCHVLFCAMESSTGYQEGAQNIYRSFRFRSQAIENKFGRGSSEPSNMGRLIIEFQDQNPKEKVDILQNIRLLPSYTKFRKQLTAWSQAALEEIAAEEKANAEGN